MKAEKKARLYTSELIDEILSEISPLKEYQVEKRLLIATKIDDVLRERGLGKKQFAEMLGKHPSEITKWLSGSHNFTMNTLTEIEFALGIKLVDTNYLPEANVLFMIINGGSKVEAPLLQSNESISLDQLKEMKPNYA